MFYRLKKKYIEIITRITIKDHTFLIVFAGLVGLGSGFGAVGFKWLISFFHNAIFIKGHDLLGISPGLHQILLPLLPMAGGLLVGPLSYFFPTEAKGHGVPEVMESVALKSGVIKPRTVGLRALASAISIGSGGSAGREGPIVQIGAAIGSTIGQMLRVSGERIKILVGCGAAGGIAATFNAPIAGVLFSLEIILGDFNMRTFSPIVISSVIATATARAIEGDVPSFTVPPYELISHWEILFYIILGVFCGLIARLYVKTLYWFEDFFEERVNIPTILKPALGGLILGIIGIFLPQIFGNGYEAMGDALNSRMIWYMAFVLIFIKILATSITLGSGGSGGIFAPSLFIGAMMGGTFGALIHSTFPAITAPKGAYALVGMGSVVAAAAHAPMTTILILFELTNDYEIILPIMVSCIVSTFIARRLSLESIYTVKLNRKGISIDQGRDVNIMNSILVKDVMVDKVDTIPENTHFKELLEIVTRSKHFYFPVVDKRGLMTGILSFQDIRGMIFEHGLYNLLVAKELATENVVTVFPDNNLTEALEKFTSKGIEQLPVVKKENPGQVIGMLRRGDVINAYNQAVIKQSMEKGR